MPVIFTLPADPFDLVIQGEQFRATAMTGNVVSGLGALTTFNLQAGAIEPAPLSTTVAGEQNLKTMVGSYPVPNMEVLRSQADGSLVGSNGLICTPTGANVFVALGGHMMDAFMESTVLFQVTGQTLDATSSALANCRVVAFETGRISKDGAPVAGETTSDGSGNFTLSVPNNGNYQLIAYKPGSPDVAGITRADVAPTAI